MKKLSSQEWSNLLGIVILDADGWDRHNFQASWSEAITIDEFNYRAGRSTVDLRRYRELFGN
ncbi:TPA: hypothetical protein ACFPCA_002191 [Neisseria meningitidis]